MPMLKTDPKIRKPTAVGARHLSQTVALSKNDYIEQAPPISQKLGSELYNDHPDEKKKFDQIVSLRESVAPRSKAAKSKAASRSRSTKKRTRMDADPTDSEGIVAAQSKRTRMPLRLIDRPELPHHDSPEPPPHDGPEPSPDVAEPYTLSSNDIKLCRRDIKKPSSTLLTDNDSDSAPYEKFYTELWTFDGRFEDAQTAEQIAVSLALLWYRQTPQAWTFLTPGRAAHLIDK